MKSLSTILLLLLAIYAQGQDRQVSGVLKTTEGSPVPYASVTIKNQQERILAFQSSDVSGNFKLTWPDTVALSNLFLEVNHLGYKKVRQALRENQDAYPIRLEQQAIDLDEVSVKSRPRIRNSGDTLSYDVGSFARAEDRTIGDVIKRMPGMEVEENGQIKYNGKAISNFYVDGDDLLDDRYAIGTKTIPHAMVQDLEVMQNHQPTKVLQGKTMSDQVALNLKIKDDAKLQLTGQVKAGAGLPGQYDGELNSILFNKRHKMLNVIKGNNTGMDLAPELTGFNQSGFQSNMGNSRPSSLLSSGTVGAPDLPTNRYYLNNSGSVNANNLFNLRKDWKLKTNASLLFDRNELAYYSANDIYLGQDTIRYTEQQWIEKNPFISDLSLRLESNTDDYYFNNTLKLAYSGETGYASLLNNERDMEQQTRNRMRDFSNTLQYMPIVGDQHVISFNWYLNHFNRPQTLAVTPGIHASILNGGMDYKQTNQYSETPTWFSNASIGFQTGKGRVKQNYQIGVQNEWQQLNSELRFTQEDGGQTQYPGSKDNQLRWARHRAYVNSTYELKTGDWEAMLSLPVSWQRIAYRDSGFGLDESANRVLFNPYFRVKYFTTAEDYLSANYVFSNQMGNINGVYRGAILTNYRSLETNDAPLKDQRAHNIGLNYNFQRNISLLFMNAGINYSKVTANTIPYREVSDVLSRTILQPYENDMSTFSANAGISKYIFALGATAGIKSTWSTTRYNQFLNDELLPYNNVSFSLTPNFEARLRNGISLKYEGTGSWITSKLVSGETAIHMPDRQVKQFDQSLSLLYSPFRNTFVSLSGRHQYVSQQKLQDISYFFADANIRYKLNKWRTDVELDLSNLANVRSYETYSLSANQFGYNHYTLRGRMAVLKLTFNL